MSEYKLLDPYIDFVFKKIFGDEKTANEVLLNLVNAILEDSETDTIQDITIKNPNIDKDSLTDKGSILDIKAVSQSGEHINIEIQVAYQASMLKRIFYYWSKLYEGQLSAGNDYDQLARTICICITKEEFAETKNKDKAHHTLVACDKTTKEQLTDILEIHIIELDKMQKLNTQMKRALRNWLKFIRGEPKEELEELAMETPGLQKAIESLEYLSQNPELREKAEQREKALKDYNSSIHGAMNKGASDRDKFIVKNMFFEIKDISQIAKLTGIGRESIYKILKEENLIQ